MVLDERIWQRLLEEEEDADADQHNDYPNNTTIATQEDMAESTISYLTDGQEMVLALLPIIPAILSICGSLCLIRLIVKAKFHRPFRRILFGMSCYDVLNSVTVTLQSFLVPKETSRRIFAIGNDQTCNMMGFLFQFSYPSFMYFGCLSIYYVLVVRFNVTDTYFARRIEPFLHAITLLWPTITAILGLQLGLYGELSLGTGCWISESAIDETCDSECIARWTWILGGLPFMIIFGLVILNNLIIYCYVRRTVKRVTRPQQQQQHTQQSGGVSRRASFSSSPETQESKVRAVGQQALLYCAVFLLTYVWTIILRLASNDGAGPEEEPKVFPIMVLRAIFLPAMGLGTVLVYTRPRYVTMRSQRQYRNKSCWWILRRVLWDAHYDTAGDGRGRRRSFERRGSARIPGDDIAGWQGCSSAVGNSSDGFENNRNSSLSSQGGTGVSRFIGRSSLVLDKIPNLGSKLFPSSRRFGTSSDSMEPDSSTAVGMPADIDKESPFEASNRCIAFEDGNGTCQYEVSNESQKHLPQRKEDSAQESDYNQTDT